MGSIGEGAAVQVVDEDTGALVAALALAEDSAHGGAVLGIQGIHSLQEVVGGPGTGLQVQVLVSASFLKGVQVHRHAVGGHNQGILVDSAVRSGAGGQNGFLDLLLVGVVQHILEVHHVAVGAPVGNQTLRAFHNQVGGVAAGDGSVHLVVAIGVGQVLNLDCDAGLGGEGVGELLNLGLLAPVADGIGPQGDGAAVSGGGVRSGGRGGVIRGGRRRRGVGGRAAGCHAGHHKDGHKHGKNALNLHRIHPPC